MERDMGVLGTYRPPGCLSFQAFQQSRRRSICPRSCLGRELTFRLNARTIQSCHLRQVHSLAFAFAFAKEGFILLLVLGYKKWSDRSAPKKFLGAITL
jgi:hypothetical protein